MPHSKEDIKNALLKVSLIVEEDGNRKDIEYFNFHKDRYLRMALTLNGLSDKKRCVLNIGSHYLHSSLLLGFLGYEVYSMDVSEFWELDFIKAREERFGINRIVENNLEGLPSQEGIFDKYDIILFTEILEHITYNPIGFWKKIYDAARSDGIIYISTPNSLSLTNIVRSIARIITFRGIGAPVNEIFRNVTYGHHWKEYSASEIRRYFSKMSDDFKVSIKKYHYIRMEVKDIHTAMWVVLSYLGNRSRVFSDDIEAVVRIKKTGSWKLEPPGY
jgi:2-polyprenyl-6-hydroxyphenyl methylase/3-demethylubiquinone-9 3-methyltransferase